MNITFGKKIPIAITQIQNRQTGEFEPATVYEVDCTDKEDYEEVENDRFNWCFSWDIGWNMRDKYEGKHQWTNSTFYVLEDQNNETISRIQIDSLLDNKYSLEWLDTKQDNKYRYVGQNILSVAASEILKKGGIYFAIFNAIETAKSFYLETCGFEDIKGFFYMNNQQMKEFIAQTEKRTQSQIINLKA